MPMTVGALPAGDGHTYKLLHDTFSSSADAGNFKMVGLDGQLIGGVGDATVSPTVRVALGHVLVFDQSEHTNWYHPLTFGVGASLAPSTAGAASEEYRVDGHTVSGASYITQFRYPKEQWNSYHSYVVVLTVTQALVDEATAGGGLYYFSALHRGLDVPGQLTIGNERAERVLATRAAFDVACGTVGTAEFAPGAGRCDAGPSVMMCGTDASPRPPLDSWIKQCFAASDCRMASEMRSQLPAHERRDVTFIQQMIPHHINAINMAKSALKLQSDRVGDAWDEMGVMMYTMINVQTEQIGFMQEYLAAVRAAPYTPGSRACPPSIDPVTSTPPPPPHQQPSGCWVPRLNLSMWAFVTAVICLLK